jgi:hypothetical protein
VFYANSPILAGDHPTKRRMSSWVGLWPNVTEKFMIPATLIGARAAQEPRISPYQSAECVDVCAALHQVLLANL